MLTGAVIACVVAAIIWRHQAHVIGPPVVKARRGLPVVKAHREAHLAQPYPQAQSKPPERTNESSRPALRARLSASRDYAALVADIKGAATAGDSEAQFVMAKALRYCDEGLRSFFLRPDKPVRSLNEAQIRWAQRPARYQERIVDVYDRCQAFLDVSASNDMPSTWRQWLHRSAAAGNPAAEADEADELRGAVVLNQMSINAAGDAGGGLALDQARNTALHAALSGDSEALFDMVDWVDCAERSSEDCRDLQLAWVLAACDQGYDCSTHSQWLQSACTWDWQCSSDETAQDYVQREAGSSLQGVQDLANTIEHAIRGGDSTALKPYL
jgi:hypothetical protein